MCGITGFIDFTKSLREDDLKIITDQLSYRGPDDAGYLFERNDEYFIGLGHRRLSIIDLSSNGHQPISFEHLTIVFNGEIYNYVEIREKLISQGLTFTSNSDTEVILKGYYTWGSKVLDHLVGMYAFAIYNHQTHKLSLFRDRAGVKPLYYSINNDYLIFASELKAILKHPKFQPMLSKQGITQYLTLGYIPAPFSIFENVFKLKQGHYLDYSIIEKSCNLNCYWNILDYYNKPRLNLSYDEAKLELEKLFLSAFNYRLVSDVDYGIFFSGGYDSTAVAAILQANSDVKFKTFTIGFNDNEYDESSHAKQIAKLIGTEHKEFFCTEKDALEIVERLPEIFDEPISDNSCIPTYLLSKITRQYVTVALSADGGDEQFGGYDKYYANIGVYKKLLSLSRIYKKLLLLPLYIIEFFGIYKLINNGNARIENIKSILKVGYAEALATKIQAKLFTQSELDSLIKQSSVFNLNDTAFDEINQLDPSLEMLNKLYAIDYKTFMADDILVKVDRAAMAVSLEGREPMLDHRIAEFAAQLPVSYKYRNGVRKSILKDVVHKYVPKEMMDRPKQGFVIPLNKWLKNDLSYLLDKFLSREMINKSDLFNYEEILKIQEKFTRGSSSDADRLWRILILQMWYIKYMGNE
jgi:asparagine synthase (glutamine-hydrolysing)